MSKIIIHPSEIDGEIKIGGAKNSALKLQVASILTESPLYLYNYPEKILDIVVQEEMLKNLGKRIGKCDGFVEISGKICNTDLVWNKRSIRNTLLILGCLLAKTGSGKVPLPGGCPLGERMYDIHVDLMRAMGAEVWEDDGYLFAENKSSSKLRAIEFELPIRSTGATENAILMAVLADGKSRIWNPHIRPEILDLISMLNKMGAKIEVRGQESIIIEGVKDLLGTTHKVLSDNMQALTYLIAGGIASRELHILNFPFKDIEVPLLFLNSSGLKYYRYENELVIRRCNPYPIDISTGPYPGINSDMQPLFAVWGALAKGSSAIVDLRFIGRYGYAAEMLKMGVLSSITDNKLIIKGGSPIRGAEVRAIDLRAGAALTLLSLVADSPTVISDFWMVERGYDDVINTLKSVNIKVENND